MNSARRQIFSLMTRCEREMFEHMGGEIPRGVLTCVPEWYVPTRADRVADEERLKKNRCEAARLERCRRRKRCPAGARKPAEKGTRWPDAGRDGLGHGGYVPLKKRTVAA